MKKTLSMFLGTSMMLASFALVLPVLATSQVWDTTGNYIVTMEYLGVDYNHDMTLNQDGYGNLSGYGGTPVGANVYKWTIQEGTLVGNEIWFMAHYTATSDAVNPLTKVILHGFIADNGTMSGTWSDNFAGGSRTGTWATASGVAGEYPTNNSSTVTVTVEKFVQGSMATAATAKNADFPMTATWKAHNTGAGSGSYALSKSNATPYRAVTAHMSKGADYKTKETVDGNIVGANCATGKPFALEGYTSGNTRAAAMSATPSMAMPSFTNLQNDKYVIVWNRDCALPQTHPGGQTDGNISGDVVTPDVALEVTSVEMVKTTATANGTFDSGWKYVFHITAPTNEQNIAMKFSDWLRIGGSGTIPAANNMRISSPQANNGGATILLTAANSYSTPNLYMTGDLDPIMPGRQVEVTVEVAVPNGTPNGSYTTSYGVQSNP